MKKLLILSLTLISPFATASELNVPNQFEDGQVTSAEQMNANFEAIQAAVNDNNARIESMQQPTKAVFQGFSTESMNGGQGLIAMQQACHNFVPGSHICNTTEFADSPYNATAVETMTGNAWILLDAQTSDLEDRRGIYHPSVACRGWTESIAQHYGKVVTHHGQMKISNCDVPNKIACCK